MATELKGKTAIITGSSRGLGKAIAITLAKHGVNVVVAARTTETHPRIAGTITDTANEINENGGSAVAIQCDVSNDEHLTNLLSSTMDQFGGIDIVVHNAAALIPGGIRELTSRKWDLLWNVNVRPLYVLASGVAEIMINRGGGHIINVSPGEDTGVLNARTSGGLPKQWATQLAMSFSRELASHNIAVNCLWPGGPRNTEGMRAARSVENYGHTSPELFAEAAFTIVQKDPSTYTGRTVTDEQVLREDGITDFSPYLESTGATTPDQY
jgi:citronellol/citronellal dehydrogenase